MSTYLGALWRYNKKLFVLACAFIAGAFVPVITGFEITPFFDWRMYAKPVQPHAEYDAWVVYYNGRVYNKPHTWQDYNRMMINYTVPHYDVIKSTGDTIPFYTKTSYVFLAAFRWNKRDDLLNLTTADLARYPAWLKRYLAQQTGETVNRLQVQRVMLAYDNRNHVIPLKAETIIDE